MLPAVLHFNKYTCFLVYSLFLKKINTLFIPIIFIKAEQQLIIIGHLKCAAYKKLCPACVTFTYDLLKTNKYVRSIR